MSDDNLIVQIQDKEKEATKMLENVEKDNGQRLTEASEEAEKIIADIEQSTKEVGQKRFMEAKEKGKEEYKRILVESDNQRRDEVEGGKTNLEKAKNHISEHFMQMFS